MLILYKKDGGITISNLKMKKKDSSILSDTPGSHKR